MVGIGFLTGRSTSLAHGVSSNGTVIVGSSSSASESEAFRWSQSSGMVGLGFLPGGSSGSCAYAVSADGSVVVGSASSEFGTEAFRWTQTGGLVGLGHLPGGNIFSRAYAVSADGSAVVGISSSGSGTIAFIWDSTNGMQNLKEVLTETYALDVTGWDLYSATGISADGKTIVGSGGIDSWYSQSWIADIGPSSLPVHYVDCEVVNSGSGISWIDAFKTIQEAIDAADEGDAIWVKRGTYFISSEIMVEKNVSIFGGFDGTETHLSERDLRINVTSLDGSGSNRCVQLRSDATLDGFTITNGNTNWGGGGMYIASSAPTVTNCTFLNNSAGQNGGGAIHSWNASPLFTNCIFAHNNGGSNGGGAIFNWDCPDVTILHCTFSNNNGGSGGGGAIYNNNSSTTVTNSILWEDAAIPGSEIYNVGGTLSINYCDLSGNVAGIVNVEGGTTNAGLYNFDCNPMFGMGYRLQAGSCCIEYEPLSFHNPPSGIINTDIDGETRFEGCYYDIGADEYNDPCKGDFDTNGDIDGKDLADFAEGNSELHIDFLAKNFGKIDCQ
jgi:probable HAF family extracellular repeat protein/predicted outer membrane repeat protein